LTASGRSSGRRTVPAANPIATLLFVAAFPAVVLFGIWQFASSRNDSSPPAPDAVAELPATTPATPLLSMRRTPAVLARETSSTAFEGALRPLGGAVLPGSCAAVSVDGVLALSDGIDTPVIPASTLKVVVAAVALDLLGPDHVFTTEVRAEIVNGAVGSVYLVGGGDPMLAADWYPDDQNLNRHPQQPATSLDSLVGSVLAAGVTTIGGNIVADATRYDAELYPPGWAIPLRSTEGGPISALLVNDSTVIGGERRTTDPALGGAEEFRRILVERGVTVVGQVTSGETPAGLPVVATISSAPLSAIVAEMLTNSDNNTAEMLLKEIGFVGRQAGSRSAGISVMVERLAAWGVPTDGLSITDGSGLSRDNAMSCATLLAVLERHQPGDVLVSGMSVAATTGTLSSEFGDTALAGRLVGKTGTLSDVKALAGYVPVEGGATIRFVVVSNIDGADEVPAYRSLWYDQLAPALASYPAGPTTDLLVPRPAIATDTA